MSSRKKLFDINLSKKSYHISAIKIISIFFLMTLVSTIQSQYHSGEAYGLSVPPSPFTPTTDPAPVSITPSTEPSSQTL
jgi:hypothetical protein